MRANDIDMRLNELLRAAGLDTLADALDADPEITGLASDSRLVEPGNLFAATPGTAVDGRAFIPDALAKGAGAVLTEPTPELHGGYSAPEVASPVASPRAPLVATDNVRRTLARMAAAFYRPQPSVMAAVTGTSGKTSVATFTRHLWNALGRPAASIGTLGIQAPQLDEPGSLTTPDPITLHRRLSGLVEHSHVDRVILEASSHGLDQFRLDGIRFRLAAFTNLGRDHLDYHPSVQHYLAAKTRLFAELLEHDGTAVLNADDPVSEGIASVCRARGVNTVMYGRAGADLRLVDSELDHDGQRLTLEIAGARRAVRLPLPGAFQAMNALAALGMVTADGADMADALAALEDLPGVPGRLEHVGGPEGAAVYVDYSHKPDALETVLSALRPHARGRLIVVVGCGGDRDRGKRPLMGRIAAEWADVAFITDDNPRSEDPAAIRSAMMAACPGGREIGDRAEAIHAAVAEARPGDVVLIAGKGHETGQKVGDRVFPFDDRDVARAAIAAVSGS